MVAPHVVMVTPHVVMVAPRVVMVALRHHVLSWLRIISGGEVQSYLVDIQPTFKKTLLVNVTTFRTEVDNFAKEYDDNGPMVSGTADIAHVLYSHYLDDRSTL